LNLGTLEGWFFLSHGPSHPHKVAWYLKVMATFVSNLLEFVNLLDGCFGWRSSWKLIWLTFFRPCLCNVYPSNIHARGPLYMHIVSFCITTKSFALLLFQLYYTIGVRSISMHGFYKWPTHCGS
jgi:hypothetical protein